MLKTSVTDAKWIEKDVTHKDKLFLQQKYGLSDTAATVLRTRIEDLDNVQDFLHPKLKNLLPDPFLLLGMQDAITRIAQAIKKNEKVVVYGDYDVDGATSCALFKNYFSQIGIDVGIYIPDRISEGYGPNKDAFTKLTNLGYKLCITVDCGILSHQEIDHANKIGLDVIVVDHHISTEVIPNATAVVNPNRIDQPNIKHTENLAAVGVSFFVLIALNRFLRDDGFFVGNQIEEPKLMDLLDLVALGTVCDIVKLSGINRALVFQGLKVIARTKNLGFAALIEELELFEEINSYHLGYVIGPHINAGGRISNSSLGSTLLSTKDKEEAKDIAQKLKIFNLKRKEIEKSAFDQAILQIDPGLENLVMVASADWHQGIIGIVASRLKDHFYLPTIVISIDDNGIGKASGRSIKGANLGAAVIAAKSEGLLIEGGGHKMAAGFSVKSSDIENLKIFFKKRFEKIDKQKIIDVDCKISVAQITQDLCKELEMFAPYGVGNPEPKFIISDIYIIQPKIVNDQHVSCILVDKKTGAKIRAIAFKSSQSKLGLSILQNTAKTILAKIKLNVWQGRQSVQVLIEDAML